MKERLNGLLEEYGAVLLNSPYNMRYFSGFSGGEGFCVVCKKQRYLLTDSRYTEMAQKEAPDFEVVEFKPRALYTTISDILRQNGVETAAFENEFIAYAVFSELSRALYGISLCGASRKINSLRMIKTADEIEKLKTAEQIGVSAFNHILKYIKAGISENDIALELEYFMRKNGASATSFDTIVVSGKKTSLPHGVPTDKKVENGDFVTMDFGCVFEGYCSDMTRTVIVGKPSEKQRRIYNTVLKAQQTGLNSIKEGVICKEADAVARSIISAEGFGKYFGHSLGHGVGLQIHELPNLSPLSNTVLKENMIVTCEPGIYVPDFGGVRIEDMVCVKKDGIVNLSENCPKELIEL